MGAFLQWVVARRLLTLVGFGVILLGAFVPWPNLAVAAVVIILGAAVLAIQIPIAMRDATEQLDGFDEPEEEWQSSSYTSYQPPAQFQPEQYAKLEDYLQPPQHSPSRVRYEPAAVWTPQNVPQSQQLEPKPEADAEVQAEPSTESAHSEPGWKVGEPAPAWRPKNIPQQ